MKLPYSMILDYVQTRHDAHALGELLTMAGFELEGIEEVDGVPVLDIKVVSNRGDGLSVMGLAREILAKDNDASPTGLYERAANRFDQFTQQFASLEAGIDVTIESEACNRFAGLTVQLDSNGVAPAWMTDRLGQAGVRSISLLVDLTNYVRLELGQPLHAYDLPKLAGPAIVVRSARDGEKLTTLNGDEHLLSEGMLMICDAERPVGAAGIMGGLDTEVSSETTLTMVESAHFSAVPVRRTRKALNIGTEASYRFERSVDPQGVVAALGRFVELLQVCDPSAKLVGFTDVYPNPVHRDVVEVRVDRARQRLAIPIREPEAQRILERLGMEVGGHGDPFYVVPPTWRPDIVREEDLIEELGRVFGYDRIPEFLPVGQSTLGGVDGEFRLIDAIRNAVIATGYQQIISHSLRSFHVLDAVPSEQRIGPRVPASPEHAILRDSLLPGLADAAARNGGRSLAVFEVGKVFHRSDAIYERRALAWLSTGDRLPVDRKNASSAQASFFSLKGEVEAALLSIGIHLDWRTPGVGKAYLHPTRQAKICAGSTSIGYLGQLHPDVASALRMPEETYVAQIDLDEALRFAADAPRLSPLSRHPSVRRDISLEIATGVPYSVIEAAVTGAAGGLLERQWLFDVFVGGNIEAGNHSLGIALQLRKPDGTFTDEEANQVRDSVVAALVELGGNTR
jgi:phenylalanyl-tRNA synthetase beta chain